MNFIICPICHKIIDLDKVKIETPADDTIVGCGLAEGDFGVCYMCTGEHDPEECQDIRECLSYTKTTFKAWRDSDQKFV